MNKYRAEANEEFGGWTIYGPEGYVMGVSSGAKDLVWLLNFAWRKRFLEEEDAKLWSNSNEKGELT